MSEPGARIRVRFADTDAAGVVYHAQYLAYFEAARVEAMRGIGHSYREIVASGLQLPVVHADVRYHRAARFDDELFVAVRLVRLGGARFTYGYRCVDVATGTVVATGTTEHACVEHETLRPRRLPPPLREALLRLPTPESGA